MAPFGPVTIGSRALDLLGVLIERRGDVVSKEEIMAAVWPKMAVEEANLFVQISALRAVLDREQSDQSSIRTVTGRGYRFIAPVNGVQAAWILIPCLVRFSLPTASSLLSHWRRRARLSPSRRRFHPPERRRLTRMVCELVGSAALSSRRADPEDLRGHRRISPRCRQNRRRVRRLRRQVHGRIRR